MNIRVIVGLGNPGAQYARNRHNIGFLAIEQLAVKLGATWQKKPLLELAEARVGAGKLLLVKPLTFMNSSGGQNGVKDISEKLGTDQFVRLKLGIDRPPAQWSVINWVLSNFQPTEAGLLEGVLSVAVEAAMAVSKDGAALAQSQFNATDLRPKPPKLEVAAKPLESGVTETQPLDSSILEP